MYVQFRDSWYEVVYHIMVCDSISLFFFNFYFIVITSVSEWFSLHFRTLAASLLGNGRHLRC